MFLPEGFDLSPPGRNNDPSLPCLKICRTYDAGRPQRVTAGDQAAWDTWRAWECACPRWRGGCKRSRRSPARWATVRWGTTSGGRSRTACRGPGRGRKTPGFPLKEGKIHEWDRNVEPTQGFTQVLLQTILWWFNFISFTRHPQRLYNSFRINHRHK